MNVYCFLKDASRGFPSREALVYRSLRLTYSKLKDRVDSLAAALISFGVKPGDRIGFCCGSCNEYIETYFAAAKIGCSFIPLDSQMKSHDFINLNNTIKLDVLFIDSKNSDIILSCKRWIISLNLMICIGFPRNGYLSYDKLMSLNIISDVFKNFCEKEDFILYVDSNDNSIIKEISSRSLIDYISTRIHLEEESGIHFLNLPAFDAEYIKVVSCCVADKHTLVIADEFHPKFWLSTFRNEKVTHVYLTTKMMDAVLNDPNIKNVDFSSLVSIRFSRSIMSVELMGKVQDIFPHQAMFVKEYGFPKRIARLEVYLNSKYFYRETHEKFSIKLNLLNSVGKPLNGIKVKIVDSAGIEVKTGQVGRLLFAEKSQSGQENLSWIPTDELAYLDQDGNITILYKINDCYHNSYFKSSQFIFENMCQYQIANRLTGNYKRDGIDQPLHDILNAEDYCKLYNFIYKVNETSETTEFVSNYINAVSALIPADGYSLNIINMKMPVPISHEIIYKEINNTYPFIQRLIPDTIFARASLFKDSNNSFLWKEIPVKDLTMEYELHLINVIIVSPYNEILGSISFIYSGSQYIFSNKEKNLIKIICNNLINVLTNVKKQQMLKEENSLLHSVLDMVDTAISISDLDRNILISNKQAGKMQIQMEDFLLYEKVTDAFAKNFEELKRPGINYTSSTNFYDISKKKWVNVKSVKIDMNKSYVASFVNLQNSNVSLDHITPLLSDREKTILSLIARGLQNKEIAAILSISIETVKFHIKNIYKKLGTTNRSELLSHALLVKDVISD